MAKKKIIGQLASKIKEFIKDKIACAYSKLVDPETLVAHPRNPNKHTDEQITRLAKIIDFRGQRSAIVVSNKSGFIVVGHGRWMAMRKLGWDVVAVDYQDFENEADEYGHMVADNAIAEWSSLDLSQINLDIADFGPFDIDLLGLKDFTIEPMEKFEIEDELREDMNKKFILEITFPNELELADIRDDLTSRGYIVKEK